MASCLNDQPPSSERAWEDVGHVELRGTGYAVPPQPGACLPVGVALVGALAIPLCPRQGVGHRKVHAHPGQGPAMNTSSSGLRLMVLRPIRVALAGPLAVPLCLQSGSWHSSLHAYPSLPGSWALSAQPQVGWQVSCHLACHSRCMPTTVTSHSTQQAARWGEI